MIEATPAVKSQSACAAPGISTVPRSVVQVPMADGESTGVGEVSVSVSSETLRIQQDKTAKFGYLSMMVVATLGSLNTESGRSVDLPGFCLRILLRILDIVP